MKFTEKQFKIIKWTTRIIATLIFLLALPFYFGYGNPLPFANPDNTTMDNIWLTTFPLMFIGLLSPLTIILLIIFPVVWMAAFMQIMYGRLLPNI